MVPGKTFEPPSAQITGYDRLFPAVSSSGGAATSSNEIVNAVPASPVRSSSA